MPRELVIKYVCDGHGCNNTITKPAKNDYTKECDDIEESGWFITLREEYQTSYYYCPDCRNTV